MYTLVFVFSLGFGKEKILLLPTLTKTVHPYSKRERNFLQSTPIVRERKIFFSCFVKIFERAHTQVLQLIKKLESKFLYQKLER